MRNDLLADIVTASGGTITDRNNRNLLLKDWLDAVKAPAVNYVARLNGADQYWQLSEDIEIFAGVDFDIEVDFFIVSVGADSAILGDSDSDDFLRVGSGGNYQTKIGGQFANLNLSPSTPSDMQSIRLSRRDGIISLTDLNTEGVATQVNNLAFSVGNLGFRFGSFPNYLNGAILNFKVKIDGTLTHQIPLTNKAQGAYQVATTTPLGENLYTQEVIENPDDADSQWSYLGDGRWFLDGDGSLSALQFLDTQDQPTSGYFEFELESISGGSITCTSSIVDGSTFTTSGIKTYYYSDLSTQGSSIQFKRRSGAVQAVIKNIKHYDADGVLIATMAGYNEDVWEQV